MEFLLGTLYTYTQERIFSFQKCIMIFNEESFLANHEYEKIVIHELNTLFSNNNALACHNKTSRTHRCPQNAMLLHYKAVIEKDEEGPASKCSNSRRRGLYNKEAGSILHTLCFRFCRSLTQPWCAHVRINLISILGRIKTWQLQPLMLVRPTQPMTLHHARIARQKISILEASYNRQDISKSFGKTGHFESVACGLYMLINSDSSRLPEV
jgi:hypothetical protein